MFLCDAVAPSPCNEFKSYTMQTSEYTNMTKTVARVVVDLIPRYTPQQVEMVK